MKIKIKIAKVQKWNIAFISVLVIFTLQACKLKKNENDRTTCFYA